MSLDGPARQRGKTRWLRRARCLVAYWEKGEFVIENYLTGKQTQISPFVSGVLQELDAYARKDDVVRHFASVPDFAGLVEKLIHRDVLVQRGSRIDANDMLLDKSWAWGHDARFFHYSSRRIVYEEDLAVQRLNLSKQALESPPPSPFKVYTVPVQKLSRNSSRARGEFWKTLQSRRTKRTFGGGPITLPQLSKILRWVWGYTQKVETSSFGSYVLKTSPSGGARHPIEVYPIVLRVDDLAPGIYHYSVRDHALARIRSGQFQEQIVKLCSNQPWVRHAGVVFVMTALLERTMWKYKQSLAYKVLCLDAGHLGQTFHLVCTRLGLAPFTTAATQDEGMERLLEIDGISETVLYTAAVGRE